MSNLKILIMGIGKRKDSCSTDSTLVFQVTRRISINNTSGSDMFHIALQDPFEYFLNFRPGKDWVLCLGLKKLNEKPSRDSLDSG